jgi:hypothetical protein
MSRPMQSGHRYVYYDLYDSGPSGQTLQANIETMLYRERERERERQREERGERRYI